MSDLVISLNQEQVKTMAIEDSVLNLLRERHPTGLIYPDSMNKTMKLKVTRVYKSISTAAQFAELIYLRDGLVSKEILEKEKNIEILRKHNYSFISDLASEVYSNTSDPKISLDNLKENGFNMFLELIQGASIWYNVQTRFKTELIEKMEEVLTYVPPIADQKDPIQEFITKYKIRTKLDQDIPLRTNPELIHLMNEKNVPKFYQNFIMSSLGRKILSDKDGNLYKGAIRIFANTINFNKDDSVKDDKPLIQREIEEIINYDKLKMYS